MNRVMTNIARFRNVITITMTQITNFMEVHNYE